LQWVVGVRETVLLGLAAMTAGSAGLLVVQSATPFTEIPAQQVLLGGAWGSWCPR